MTIRTSTCITSQLIFQSNQFCVSSEHDAGGNICGWLICVYPKEDADISFVFRMMATENKAFVILQDVLL